MPSFRLGIEEHMHNLWGWECRNWKAFRAKGCPYLATVYSVVPKWRFALKELIGKYLSYVVFELPRLSMCLKYPWQDVTVNHHCQLDRFRISMETPPDVYEDVSTEGRHPGCVPQHHSGVGWSWTGRGEGCEGELSASLSFPLPDSECSVAIAICSVATARATRDNVPLSPFTMDFISPQTGK